MVCSLFTAACPSVAIFILQFVLSLAAFSFVVNLASVLVSQLLSYVYCIFTGVPGISCGSFVKSIAA